MSYRLIVIQQLEHDDRDAREVAQEQIELNQHVDWIVADEDGVVVRKGSVEFVTFNPNRMPVGPLEEREGSKR